MSRSLTSAFALLARFIPGVVWIWAGGAKLGDLYNSAQAVWAYEILSWRVANVVGHVLPAVEVVVGLALIAGLLSRFVGAASGLMLIAFVIGIASVWARGIEIDCGCFGGGGYDPNASAHYPWEIARDVGLLLCSAFVVWQGGGRWSADRWLLGTKDDDGE